MILVNAKLGKLFLLDNFRQSKFSVIYYLED
jgi:hypothetical protein